MKRVLNKSKVWTPRVGEWIRLTSPSEGINSSPPRLILDIAKGSCSRILSSPSPSCRQDDHCRYCLRLSSTQYGLPPSSHCFNNVYGQCYWEPCLPPDNAQDILEDVQEQENRECDR